MECVMNFTIWVMEVGLGWKRCLVFGTALHGVMSCRLRPRKVEFRESHRSICTLQLLLPCTVFMSVLRTASARSR
jgi:hypothetical protein